MRFKLIHLSTNQFEFKPDRPTTNLLSVFTESIKSCYLA